MDRRMRLTVNQTVKKESRVESEIKSNHNKTITVKLMNHLPLVLGFASTNLQVSTL